MNRLHQLDLFGDKPIASTKAPGDVRSSLSRPKAFVAPPTPPDNLPPSVRWRVVDTPIQAIGFQLRRSRRRSLGLTVNDDGLTVTAPQWVTLAQIDAAVREKATWIVSKLRHHEERAMQLATAQTQWRAGGTIPYLGKQIVLLPDNRHREAVFSGQLHAPHDGDQLSLPLPPDVDRERLRDTTHAWLQHQAKRWLAERLDHFLTLQGSTMRSWRLSAAATRWGSCSSDGRLMLNWRLIHFTPSIIDYVVAHEVAHLKHLNHSPAFWQQVEHLLPGFAEQRQALRPHHPGSLPLL